MTSQIEIYHISSSYVISLQKGTTCLKSHARVCTTLVYKKCTKTKKAVMKNDSITFHNSLINQNRVLSVLYDFFQYEDDGNRNGCRYDGFRDSVSCADAEDDVDDIVQGDVAGYGKILSIDDVDTAHDANGVDHGAGKSGNPYGYGLAGNDLAQSLINIIGPNADENPR